MTEDDTFLTLRKMTFEQMQNLWQVSPLSKDYTINSRDVDKFFIQYGWSYIEFMQDPRHENSFYYAPYIPLHLIPK